MSGRVTIDGRPDGTWSVTVDGRKPRVYRSLDEALIAAGDVTFAPGQIPGSWNVLINEP